jgi:hypothetical protein
MMSWPKKKKKAMTTTTMMTTNQDLSKGIPHQAVVTFHILPLILKTQLI